MITVTIRRNVAIVAQDETEILTMLGTNVEQVAKRLVALYDPNRFSRNRGRQWARTAS